MSGKPKRHLKNYLLNKEFQLTYALIMVVISVLLTSLLGYLIYHQANNASQLQKKQSNEIVAVFKKQSEETRAVFKKKTKESTDILQLMMTEETLKDIASQNLKDLKKNDKIDVAKLTKSLNDGIKKKEDQLGIAAKIQKKNKQRIFIGVFVFSILFIVILFVYSIILTHKVAGPLFKISGYFDKLENNNLVPVWPLRKGDQLIEFYNKFQSAYKSVVRRTRKDIEILENSIDSIEDKDSETYKMLNDLLTEKKTSLEGNDQEI
jgi:hypothetical protein